VTKEKCFITLMPLVNLIVLFFFVTDDSAIVNYLQ
jgi:hypothetical protein